MVKIYFVAGKNPIEKEVIQQLQPPRILVSYFYFKNIKLADLCDWLGYTPEIMLDSGAFSAWKSGKIVNPMEYIQYAKDNAAQIHHMINFDVVGNGAASYHFWHVLRAHGLQPLPVIHYGDNEEVWIQKYLSEGAKYILLGGSVGVPHAQKIEWCKMLCWQFPEADFHLLGSHSAPLINQCDLYSVDASGWIMLAINGLPAHIEGKGRAARQQRMIWHMRQLLEIEKASAD